MERPEQIRDWDPVAIGAAIRDGNTVHLHMPEGHEIEVSPHESGAIWRCCRCGSKCLLLAVGLDSAFALTEWLQVHQHDLSNAS